MNDKQVNNSISEQLRASSDVKLALLESHIGVIGQIADSICQALKAGGKVMLFGNGGSAADAQHIASELVGRYKIERPAMSALALTTDTSLLTALSNDYDFNQVFVRQVQSMTRPCDVIVGITTSGKSANVLNALREGSRLGAKTVCFSGMDGGPCAEAADISLIVPSSDVPRIQEAHITVGHIVCHLVEEEMFAAGS